MDGFRVASGSWGLLIVAGSREGLLCIRDRARVGLGRGMILVNKWWREIYVCRIM